MKLVQLKRRVGDGSADVVASVGPLADDAADAYASQLLQLVEEHAGLGLSVGTTSVESTSGEAAEPPAGPAELLRAVLSREEGAGDREPDLPPPEPRT